MCKSTSDDLDKQLHYIIDTPPPTTNYSDALKL